MNLPMVMEKDLLGFLLVFLRVVSVITFMPIFGDRVVPARLKGMLALLLALLLYSSLRGTIVPAAVTGMVPLFLGMAGEVLIGLVMGLMIRFVFVGVQYAGEMIGFQMGFAIVNVIDPVSSVQVSLIAQLQYFMAVLLFLALDGHHGLILAMKESFQVIPSLAFQFSGSLMELILQASKEIFIIAVKLSAPIIAVLMFTHVALGLVARTVPQINVFIVGFPIQIAMGLLFLGLSSRFILTVLEGYFLRFPDTLKGVLHWMVSS